MTTDIEKIEIREHIMLTLRRERRPTSKAYRKGILARLLRRINGGEPEQNPYKVGTTKHEAYRLGFIQGRHMEIPIRLQPSKCIEAQSASNVQPAQTISVGCAQEVRFVYGLHGVQPDEPTNIVRDAGLASMDAPEFLPAGSWGSFWDVWPTVIGESTVLRSP